MYQCVAMTCEWGCDGCGFHCRFQDKIELRILNGPTRMIPVSAHGVGTTIVSDPPLLPGGVRGGLGGLGRKVGAGEGGFPGVARSVEEGRPGGLPPCPESAAGLPGLGAPLSPSPSVSGPSTPAPPPHATGLTLGPHFSGAEPLVHRFTLTNRGRRHQSLVWSTEGFPIVQRSARRSGLLKPINPKDMKYKVRCFSTAQCRAREGNRKPG